VVQLLLFDHSVWTDEEGEVLMKAKIGFTLIEVMMAVLVMAIVATLAIGAVLKSRKHPGDTRIQATCIGLQMGLTNYRAAEQRWPLTLELPAGSNVVEFCENNASVFAPLFENPKKLYLDPSAVLTKVSGKGVMPLRKAMELRITPTACPLGYSDPANKEIFRYFKVMFNLSQDTVRVEP
jgi:prepilin-type N-terminal cleavage/methylation domain-containing protein